MDEHNKEELTSSGIPLPRRATENEIEERLAQVANGPQLEKYLHESHYLPVLLQGVFPGKKIRMEPLSYNRRTDGVVNIDGQRWLVEIKFQDRFRVSMVEKFSVLYKHIHQAEAYDGIILLFNRFRFHPGHIPRYQRIASKCSVPIIVSDYFGRFYRLPKELPFDGKATPRAKAENWIPGKGPLKFNERFPMLYLYRLNVRQMLVLQVILLGKRVTQSSLARDFHISRSAINIMLNELKYLGLIAEVTTVSLRNRELCVQIFHELYRATTPLPKKREPAPRKETAPVVISAQHEEWDENQLWSKLDKESQKAGQGLVEDVLYLYFAMLSKETPQAIKFVILGALIYFINPLDAVPDYQPGGYVDDLGAIKLTFHLMKEYLDASFYQQAKETAKRYFQKSTQ